jgi:hypothetical protein
MASEQEKIDYLSERIGYDVAMLNYTFMRLLTSRSTTSEERLDCNVVLESFGVHAWNLVQFLSKKSREDDHGASDYVPDFAVPNGESIDPALARLEKQMLHVAALRANDRHETFDVNDARNLYAWLVPAILKFQKELAPQYRESLGALGQVETLLEE